MNQDDKKIFNFTSKKVAEKMHEKGFREATNIIFTVVDRSIQIYTTNPCFLIPHSEPKNLKLTIDWNFLDNLYPNKYFGPASKKILLSNLSIDPTDTTEIKAEKLFINPSARYPEVIILSAGDKNPAHTCISIPQPTLIQWTHNVIDIPYSEK